MDLKGKVQHYLGQFRSLLRETPIEVPIVAALGLVIGLGISYKHEADKAKIIPVAFSEISQIERNAEAKHQPVPPLTRFYASTNDMVMKVFECWNISNKYTLIGSNTTAFARELEAKMDPSLRIHKHEIPDFTKNMTQYTDASYQQLKDFLDVLQKIRPTNNYFDAAWNDDHNDVYHTEIYFETETSTDSDGNTHSELVMHTRQVYDYTIHTYDYNNREGEQASRSLDDMLSKHSALKTPEELTVVNATQADNEDAIERSREKQLKGKRLSPQELLSYAKNWAEGSTYKTNLSTIHEMMDALKQDNPKWDRAKTKAHSTKYKTYSHSDSGPLEFQVAETALEHGRTLEKNIAQIKQGIDFVREKAPVLQKKIEDYIAVVLDKKQGNPNKLKKELLSLAKDVYSKNFKKGFDVEQSKWYMVVIWSILGAAAGAGLGFGIDQLGGHYDLYDEKKYKGYKLSDYHNRNNRL
jgi:predicted transcriptional regulator